MNCENSTMEIAAITEQVRLEAWHREAEAQQLSGKSVKAWCARNGVSQSGYYYRLRWLRLFEQVPVIPIAPGNDLLGLLIIISADGTERTEPGRVVRHIVIPVVKIVLGREQSVPASAAPAAPSSARVSASAVIIPFGGYAARSASPPPRSSHRRSYRRE